VWPMPPEVIDYLKPVVKKCKADDYLFPTLRHDLPKRFRAAARRAGINTNLTLHDLRHVCGSLLMMSGGLAVAQAVLGHKDISTTADIYGHLTAVHLAKHLSGASDERKLSPEIIKSMDRAEALASELLISEDEKTLELVVLVLEILPIFAQ